MERTLISLSEGKIQGTTLKSIHGKNYLAFRGIPYAQPPLGNLRFRAPEPPSNWSGIRDASKFSSMPMQIEKVGPQPFEMLGCEDCLYLNVYTNGIGHKRPVMFYIFGGIFFFGNANEQYEGVDHFMNNDVILVIPNYRVGPLGFLNLGHEVASGNQGIRDLIMALKWVQRNIEAFGGDSSNVTIFGHSSGAVLCHLFTLIPQTKNLFHKAIMQSGTCFLTASLRLGKYYKNGFKIASLLGMNSDDPVKVFEFLQTVPAEDLITLEGKLLDPWNSTVLGYLEYSPNLDAEYTTNPVIPLPINEMLNKNDIDFPIIIGNVPDEVILFFQGQHDKDHVFKFHDEHIEEIVKSRLNLKDLTKFPETINLVREFYLNNKPIKKDTMWNLFRLLSDLFFIHVNRKFIDQRIKNAKAPTYFYNFSHLGNEITIYTATNSAILKGVAHADELSYMFYLDRFLKVNQEQKKIFAPKDKLVIKRLVNMWCNFAATGNPTPKIDDRVITTNWKPTSKDNLYYLDIGEELVLKNDKDSKSRIFYEKIKEGFLNM